MSDPGLDVAVYGIINAGKSSLINALAGRDARPAGPIGGTTAQVAGVEWRVVEESEGMALAVAPPPLPSHAREVGDGPEGSAIEADVLSETNSRKYVPHFGSGPTSVGPITREYDGAGPTEVGPTREDSSGGVLQEPDQTIGTSPARYAVRLIDTPGLEEVGDEGRSTLATQAVRRADLVLFVLAEDLTATARTALVGLREVGKPILVALNKVDLLDPEERDAVLGAVRSGLAGLIPAEDVIPVAAAPIVRRRVAQADGSSRIETARGEPEVGELEARLLSVLSGSASDLKRLAEATASVERHVLLREADRARRRERAERVADESSVALAVALAVNPVPLLDFLTGPGGLTILARRVAEAYDEPMTADVARKLALELIRGGRVALWGSLAGTIAGGAFKLVPGLGHLAGALTQGASAGYFAHVVGRALVGYLDRGHDWGEGGLVAELDRIAASTDRKALTRGLVDRIKARLRGGP